MAKLLTDTEIATELNKLPGWNLVGKEIQCQRKFKDFIAAIDFVNQLVEPAEAAGHHPDLTISYNRVGISLSTHDAGGLTEADFRLAQIISKI